MRICFSPYVIARVSKKRALYLQDAVSKSGRLAQLPAIAEDSQAAALAAPPTQLGDDSLTGPSRTTVPALVLERGLRGALEAQRGLQAGRRHREKLLRALGKVMPFVPLDLTSDKLEAKACFHVPPQRQWIALCAGEGELAGSSTHSLSKDLCPRSVKSFCAIRRSGCRQHVDGSA